MAKYKPVIEMITALGFAVATLMLLFTAALATDGIEGIWMVAAAFAELGLLVGGVYFGFRYFQRRSGRTLLEVVDQDEMKAKRSLGDDGELIILGHEPGTRLFTFQGKGNQVMDQTVHLTSSLYRMKYDCPPGIGFGGTLSPSTAIKMIDVEQDAIIPLMDVAGAGSQTFSVEADGRYVFQVTCEEKHRHKKWRIECTQL